MKMKIAAGVLVTVTAAWGLAGEDAVLAPDAWQHDGDRDGDGLLDGFETSRGLNPDQPISFEDGIVDESRLASDGRSMWEVQEAENNVPTGGGADSGSGGACGILGIEALLVLILGRRRRLSGS